jgi:hypothetical protein
MDDQKKWFTYGDELTGALSELVNFERTFKPELEKKIREHGDLEDRADKLAGKLTQAQAALDMTRAGIFADLREKAARIRSDMMKAAGTPTLKARPEPDNYVEMEIADRLLSKAKSGAAASGAKVFPVPRSSRSA